jgi:uncharacterized membrane protein YhaH (DUF805 family)
MSRPLTVLALVWAPFLSIFLFASQGDTSALHIASHLLALALLVPATVMVRRLRAVVPSGVRRWVLLALSVTVPAAVVGHVGELGVAVVRLAQDGWVNLDTHDVWEAGPHLWISNLTVPAMMLSMLLSVALVVATAASRRREDDPVIHEKTSRVR